MPQDGAEQPAEEPRETRTVVERRRSARAPVTVRIEYATVDALFSEFARDINEGGLFIETEEPLPLDTPIHLQFRLPGSTEPVRAVGRVVWTSPPETQGRVGMGVEFESLASEDLRRIDALVHRLRVEPGGSHDPS